MATLPNTVDFNVAFVTAFELVVAGDKGYDVLDDDDLSGQDPGEVRELFDRAVWDAADAIAKNLHPDVARRWPRFGKDTRAELGQKVLAHPRWAALAAVLQPPVCGHSGCRQHWIDTGENGCVEADVRVYELVHAARAALRVVLERAGGPHAEFGRLALALQDFPDLDPPAAYAERLESEARRLMAQGYDLTTAKQLADAAIRAGANPDAL